MKDLSGFISVSSRFLCFVLYSNVVGLIWHPQVLFKQAVNSAFHVFFDFCQLVSSSSVLRLVFFSRSIFLILPLLSVSNP